MKKEHEHHIRHLKRHRNVLYGVVVILLILQIISFVTISSQVSRINAQQSIMKDDIESYFSQLGDEIDVVKQESQFGVHTLTQELAQQKSDVQSQISLLKASQEDFSGVIEEVIKSVVNVGTDKSAGTGFVVKEGGYIVTNLHVLQDANYVKIQSFDGSIYDANIVGIDPEVDLALLQVPNNFEALQLADSDNVEIGEKVIAIGNPLGLSFTVTEGIVSSVDRTGPSGLEAYIQTDVTLNPGNSGGPLINKKGEVIGINNFKIGGAEGLGFALESNIINERTDNILNPIPS